MTASTEPNRVCLTAPIWVEREARHLVLAERSPAVGPFDTRCILITQFLTNLAGATLHNAESEAEQDRLARRLAVSESHFRQLFEEVDVGLALVDEDDVIQETNPALPSLLGEVLPGQRFSAHLHPLDRAAETRRFQALLAGQVRHYRVELRFLRGQTAAWARLTTASLPGFPLAVRTLVDISFSRMQALMELEEQEKTWLASDLHDGPAQTAAALGFQLQAEAARHPCAETHSALNTAGEVSIRLRSLLAELSNPVLASTPLEEALSRRLGLVLTLKLPPLPAPALIYRLVHEAACAVPGPYQLTAASRPDQTRLVLHHGGRWGRFALLRQRCRLLGGEIHVQPGRLEMVLPF